MAFGRLLRLEWTFPLLIVLLEKSVAKFNNPTHILAFGDSLSDQGNTFVLSNGKEPAADTYYKGRYTNGPNWLDILGKRVKGSRVRSFAYGSSTACPGFAKYPGILSGVQQVNASYTEWLAKKPSHRSNSKLVFIWTGHNDIMVSMSIFKFNATAVAQSVASCVRQMLETLIASGETKIVVNTLSPIDLTPAATAVKLSSIAFNMVNATNTALNSTVQAVQQKYAGSRKKIQVVLYDQNAFVRTWNHTAAGVTDFTSSCAKFANATTWSASSICPDPDAHFWYDSMHPTEIVHKYSVDFLYPFLKNKGWVR